MHITQDRTGTFISIDAGCKIDTSFLVARNVRCDVRLKLDPGVDQDWQDNTSLVSIRCTVISASSLLDCGHGKVSTMLTLLVS